MIVQRNLNDTYKYINNSINFIRTSHNHLRLETEIPISLPQPPSASGNYTKMSMYLQVVWNRIFV